MRAKIIRRLGLALWLAWPTAISSCPAGNAPTPLRLATFRADVSPPIGSPLCGGWIPPVAAIDEPLWAKGLVLEDPSGTRYVLCAIDYCELRNAGNLAARERLAQAVGTTAARVVVQSLHQHNAPLIDPRAQELATSADPSLQLFNAAAWQQALVAMGQAAEQAVAKLTPCDTVAVGRATVDRVASSRRVFDEQRVLHVRWSATREPLLQQLPEGHIDPELRTVTFLANQRPLVRLHYYATHPQSFYGDGRVTSDVPGLAREQLEREESVPQIYFTGCAGDVTMGKYNDGSPEARQTLVARLLGGMRAAVANSQPHAVGAIAWRTVPVQLPPRPEAEFSAASASAQLAHHAAGPQARSNAALLLAFLERIEQPIDLALLRVGPALLVHLPGEPFIDYQFAAQRLAPEQFVATAGYGDGGPGYVCTARAYSEGGYEPTASFVGPRTEAVLQMALSQLLAP